MLKEFKYSLDELNIFPKDELRDYYLFEAHNLLKSNSLLFNIIDKDNTALTLVLKYILKKGLNSIRLTHLNLLALEIIEKSNTDILNYQDKEGNSAVHLACKAENFSVGLLDSLYDFGASFNLINKKGETPLILVAGNESLDDLKFIHSYSDIDKIDYHENVYGNTPLIKAVLNKKINNIYYLLESGANVFEVNNMGKTAKDIIKEYIFHEKSKSINHQNSINHDILTMLTMFEDLQKNKNKLFKIAF